MVKIICLCFSLFIGMYLFGQNTENENKSGKHFFNLTESVGHDAPFDFNVPNKPYKSLNVNYVNVNLVDTSQGEKIDDKILLKEIYNALNILVPSYKYSIGDKAEVFYLGDVHFKSSVITKLVYVSINEGNEYRLRVLLGLNTFDNKVVSIIKLSESVRIIGFGNLFYSQYKNGMFKLITSMPSDVTGKIKNSRRKIRKIRMRNKGQLH